ncbi:adenosylmethionine decarboxylase [Candidatus Aerophobetes bacterium]|nr:adenosylmethionine decarboxylase [Candidatus Aerophobetes bacterium]
MRRRDNFGIHIISDLYGCEPERLARAKQIKQFIEQTIDESGLTKIKSCFHQFDPYGVTGLVLLSESHLAIHTWPEYRYVSLDVYSCGPPDASFFTHKKVIGFFNPKKACTSVFTRGKIDESHRISDIKTLSHRA